MFDVFIERYTIPLDKISFFFIIANFAAVGTIAIFYQKGIPTSITQTYLILISVILAWQLSHFNTWTAWTLLVMLALYDLCAVLTPCGPLKFLVNLLSKDDAPDMPGLLYEANLPVGVERPGRQAAGNVDNNERTGSMMNRKRQTRSNEINDGASMNNPGNEEHHSTAAVERSPLRGIQLSFSNEDENNLDTPPTGRIPLAIALIYRLEVLSPASYASLQQDNETLRPVLSSFQLRTDVEVQFPIRGGKIVAKEEEENENSSRQKSRDCNELQLRYAVLNRHGLVKRILIVNEEGKVFQEVRSERTVEGNTSGGSIKLGLGDFIFYSVLVAKATEYSFTTFAACTLVILSGLGGTLILLSVYHKALPALPLSIFLGIIFYLLTRISIEPWIQYIMKVPIYV